MLRIPDKPPLTVLRDFLMESCWEPDRLGKEFGLKDGLFATRSNLLPLLERTAGDTRLAVLARLFFVGWPTSQELCRKHIPDPILQLCLDANLLTQEGGDFAPFAVILPFEDLLVASDAPRLRGNNPNVVIGPSPSTKLLSRATLQTRCESVLDVGTGTGVLALFAARFSDQSVGVDINDRAIEFSRFSAALNGISNVEFLSGDAFAPVTARRFSRIVANPPFFLTPRKQFAYSDSPLELDGFTRKLAVEAPQHLEEDGVFQMLCEWVQIEGEPWEQRLLSWTAASGCDVLVLLGPISAPIDYAEKRATESAMLYSSITQDLMPELLNYLRHHRVEQVLVGLLTMRKRKGRNWFATLPSADIPKVIGVAIQHRLEALTFLKERTDDRLLQARLQLTRDTAIRQTSTFHEDGWQATVQIAKTDGIDDVMAIDFAVLQAIELFDGSRTVEEVTSEVAKMQNISAEEAKTRSLVLAKRLLQSTFVMPLESASNQQ
jgi:methylase of polypeptide subunit release factors